MASPGKVKAVINIKDKNGNVWYTDAKCRAEASPSPTKPRRERASALALNEYEKEVYALAAYTTSPFWKKFIENLANRKDKKFSIDTEGKIIFSTRLQSSECNLKISGDDPESMLEELMFFAKKNGVVEISSYSHEDEIHEGSPISGCWADVPPAMREVMLGKYTEYLVSEGVISLSDMRVTYRQLIQASNAGMIVVTMRDGMITEVTL